MTGVALEASDEALASWRARGVDPYVVDLAADDYGGLPSDFDYVVHTAAAVYPEGLRGRDARQRGSAGLLMRHTRSARAFLHVSTSGVYVEHDDPWYRAMETDVIGGSKLMGHYTGTKAAGEGAVRAMARVLNLPTVICRMDVQYGTYADGGLPVMFLADIINGVPIVLPKSYDWVKALVHQDDLQAFIAPSLAAATVPATTVNWSGDEALKGEDWIGYLGSLVGIEPVFVYDDDRARPGRRAERDPAHERHRPGHGRLARGPAADRGVLGAAHPCRGVPARPVTASRGLTHRAASPGGGSSCRTRRAAGSAAAAAASRSRSRGRPAR